LSKRIPVDRGVHIYKHGSTWWLDCHQGGRRIRKGLKTTDQRKALVIARQVAGEIAAKTWNVAEANELTIDGAIERYHASTEWSNLAPGTKLNTDRTLNGLKSWLEKNRVDLVDNVLRDHMDQFAKWKAGQPHPKTKNPLSPVTVNQWMGRVAAFFGWLQNRGYIRYNPASRIRLKVRPPEPKPVLTGEQIAKLADACSPVLRDLVLVIAETALRISEAVEVRAEHVDLTEKVLRIYAVKTNRWEYVPLNEAAYAILAARKLTAGTKGHIFQNGAGEPICRRNVRRDLLIAGKKAGIRVSGPHMLRRTCITYAAKVMTPSELKEFARHRDIRTTQSFYVGRLGVRPPIVVPQKQAT